MKRIETENREKDKFGPGRDGFRASVPGVSDPTYLSALFINSVQEALVRTIERAGLVPDNDYDQFANAVLLGVDLAKENGAARIGTTTGETVEERLAAAITAEVLKQTVAGGSVETFAAGVPLPGVSARFHVTESITTHARYAVLDNSTLNYATAAFQGHASFNSNIKIEGPHGSDHHHDYQSYTHYRSAGALGRFSSFWSQLEHTGSGNINEASLVKVSNPLGSGPITSLYGVYIEPLTRGASNFAIYAPGSTVSYFGGMLALGQMANPAYFGHNPTTNNLDLVPRTGYSVCINAPIRVGDPLLGAEIKYNNNTGNLDIKPRASYCTSISGGALLVGNATAQASAERLNVSFATTDYLARFYNSDAAAPKGLAIIYSGAAPNGTGNEFLYCQDSVAVRMKVLSNGNLQNVNNVYGALSDVRLKENIVDATPKLAKLLQVRVVNYNLKADPDQKQLGVIADELAELFPGMVEETIEYEDVEVEPARAVTTITQRQKTVPREEVHIVPQLVDGQWRNVPTPVTVDAPAFQDHPLFDEHGAPLMEIAEAEQPEITDEDGKVTRPYKAAVYSDRQRVHQVPVMEDVTESIDVPARYERRPTGRMIKSVKYSVFVPMLIKALQELNSKVDSLTP